MRRKLLTLGALGLTLATDAQFLTYVGDKGQVYVKQGALVYNGGGMRTVGSGLVDNSGNIMVVGGASAKFATTTTSGTDKTDGGNIIMRMTNDAIGSFRYGQLYIKGLSQENITGIVDKQYKDVANGAYQQIALPFYGKLLSGLSGELGKTFSSKRWSQDEILVWNNGKARFDLLSTTSQTSNATAAGVKPSLAYYAIGSKGFNAASAIKTVKGVPYADGITETLTGAAAGINFGANGSARNYHGEVYNTYLQDAYSANQDDIWTGDYGKNIYQFGNPFFTNLDLGRIGNKYTDIAAIRVEPQGVKITEGSGYSKGFVTESTSATYIAFDDDGIAIGDVNAVVRPMQTFVVKTMGMDAPVIDFDELRSFSYTPRELNASYDVTSGLKTKSVSDSDDLLRSTSLQSKSSGSVSTTRTLSVAKVKQLGVIALDANGIELGRTYYYVSPSAITGKEQSEKKRQVVASGSNVIGTFEESVNGGFDDSVSSKYWLYINEANENDFKGKEVPLMLYDDAIKSLKFEVRENANLIADNASLSNGENFYIQSEKGGLVAIKNGMVLASNTDAYGLFYGNPNAKVEDKVEVIAPVVEVRTETDVVFDTNEGVYKVLFASDWNTATVTVYNRFGRVVSTANVDAKSNYTIVLPKQIGAYIVRAVSDKGDKFSKKILKN